MPTRSRWLLVLDLVAVLLFALVGRASHAEGVDPLGVLATAWPFLVAWIVAVLITRAWRDPARMWPTGVIIWLVTVAGGMLLRVVSGDTAAPAFVVVATITVAVLMLGWRLVALVVRRVQRHDR